MFKILLINSQIFAFRVLIYLLKKLCPVSFVIARLKSGRILSVAEGRKDLFVVGLVETLTGNEILDPVLEKSLEIARLRKAGRSDEEVVKMIQEFVKEQ